MKLMIYLLILSFSVNSLAFFGIFKSKVDPSTLKTYEERMDYLLNNDPVFKKYWNERKDDLNEFQEANLKELRRIEEEIADSGKYTDESVKKMKEENDKKNKEQFDRKMKEMELQLMSEWTVIDGEFVNIKDHNEKIAKQKAEQEELRRIQQFQSEEGLPVSRKIDDVRINVD